MKVIFYTTRSCFFMLLIFGTMLKSQTLEERLIRFGEVNGKSYIKPFVNAFGANLNSGIYYSADVSTGIDVFVGGKFMFAIVPSNAMEFDADMTELNELRTYPLAPYPSPIRTATILGKDGTMAKSGGAVPDSFKFPNGMNLKVVPLIIPQVSIGNIFGTKAILRYFPYTKLGNWGEVSFMGLGIQHSIDQWIPALPFDWSGHIMYHSLKIKPILNANAFSVGTEISKTFIFATLYAGIAYETSSMEFKYDWKPPLLTQTRSIALKVDGDNSFRFTTGISLKWLIFNINAEYGLSKQSVAVLGLGINI